MTDRVEKIGRSTVQHGPFNDRVYLMKLARADTPGILPALDELASREGYSKIFAKIPAWQKLAMMALILGGVGILYYQFWYSEYDEQIAKFANEERTLKGRITELNRVAEDMRKHKLEAERLEEENKELQGQLPQDKAIASLLTSFENEANLIGMSIPGITPGAEVPKDLYAEIPIELTLRGSYHEVMKFFYRVGRLPRIVNIGDIEHELPEVTDDSVSVTVKCTATTYRYLKPEERGAKPAGGKG